ncbi:hypothetical protein [Xanthomonas sp. LMG 12461]|uniref:hypothetical protein n=1 Tax=Xanthomonas sp. LMG 12461 TaxID=2014543 RepID=UPI001264B5EB|nr:hypothetical protein [Xanthomonas sp. LMG 12461]KAB7765391.1 hypothetical protein CEK68_11900 [Xanthomonas sp. LMG 12461]
MALPIQLRGYMVADAPQVLWARDDQGPLNLAGDTVQAHIRPPAKSVDLQVIPATGAAAGLITFTVPTTLGNKYGPGLYQLTIVSAAYGVTHDGTLEIV